MVMVNLVTYRTSNGYSTDNDAFKHLVSDPAYASAPLEIYFPAGGGLTGGAYEIWSEYWDVPNVVPAEGNITRGDLTIYGDPGYGSVVRQRDDKQVVFLSHPPQSAPSRILSNIEIRDLLLDGNLFSRTVNGIGYDENIHLIRVAGVTNLKCQGVYFRNFSGEGLNLSSVLQSLTPRNANLVVRSCLFEGFPGIQGRNAIAILDCATWLVDSCTFRYIGSTRTGFQPGPGAIDIEPEIAGAIVTNGTVTQCVFDGLNRNALAVLNGPGANVQEVDFINCQVRNAKFGIAEIRNSKKVRINNVIAQNLSLETNGPILTVGASQEVTMLACNIEDAGFCRLEAGAHMVSINNNAFTRCGNTPIGVVLQSGGTTFFSFLYNQLYNCGIAGQPSPIYYLQNNVEFKYSNIKWNTVHSPNNIDRVGLVDASYIPPPMTSPLYDYIDPLDNYPATLPQGNLPKKP